MIYKARQSIYGELVSLLGEIRDFDGGMISKEKEMLDLLKQSLGAFAKLYPVLIDLFYFSLDPIEARTAFDIGVLKEWFLLLLSSIKTEKEDLFYKQDATHCGRSCRSI